MSESNITFTKAAEVVPPQAWFGVSAIFHYLGPSFAALHTEEAKRLPPNSPMIVGMESIQAFIQAALDAGAGDLQATIIDLHENGDMAYAVGKYTLTIQP